MELRLPEDKLQDLHSLLQTFKIQKTKKKKSQ